MNKKQQYLKERDILNLVRISNRKLNCLRWHSSETKEHIFRKLEICMWLKRKSYNFITEAIFESGQRADILDLTRGVVIEVLHTEELEDCKNKIKNYPEEVEVRFISCKNDLLLQDLE